MPSHDTNLGAKRAREARETLGLGPAAPLDCILRTVEGAAGVPVIVAALGDGIGGCCWHRGERLLIWVNGMHAPVRQRFTLAHELGHCFCNHDDYALAVDTFETLSGTTTEHREVQANAFAAEFLAPADAVRALAGADPGLDEVVALGAHFGISSLAALFRLGTLRIVEGERTEALRALLDGDAHTEAWERLGLSPREDGLAEIYGHGRLPRIPDALAGTALAALARGDTSVGAVASAAGVDPGRIAAAAGLLGS
jgi:Zn-dependent peptidase ImmA (M78 family)